MNWQALASAVVRRRVELGYGTRREFIDASGMKARTLGDIETARKSSYDSTTLARLEQALRWEPGTVKGLLGSEPLRPVFNDAHEAGHRRPVRVADGRKAQPPAPVDIGPELATIDGLAMWMRPDFHPLGFLLHHAGLDERARFTVSLEMREVTDRAVLGFLDALAAMVRREGGTVRPEAWPAHLVDRFGWTIPDGEEPESAGDGR